MSKLRPIDRFTTKVVRSGFDSCWHWAASLNADGYGSFYADGKRIAAHRWSYIHFIGEIPNGLQLDHLCRNRACVNPAHLEAVTPRENCRRGMGNWRRYAAREQCGRGHEYTPENTYRRGRVRHCRACRRIHWRDWANRARAAALREE